MIWLSTVFNDTKTTRRKDLILTLHERVLPKGIVHVLPPLEFLPYPPVQSVDNISSTLMISTV